MDDSLRKTFNRFAGRQVDMRLGLKDPVLQSIDAIAQANGMQMRVWIPGGTHINDHNPNRVNVHLGPSRGYKSKIVGITFGS